MKKFIIASGLLIMFFAGTAAAKGPAGIGLYANLVGNSAGFANGLGLTFRYGPFPVIGLEWNILQHSSMFSGSVDGWVVNKPIAGIFSYYVGLGGYLAVTSVNSSRSATIGGRIPIGLQLTPVDPLELFLEISPMIIFLPTIDWSISIRIGFRVLF